MAVFKALPTDEEVEAAGAADAGAFIMELRATGAYSEWVEAWNTTHDAPMFRATQPAHRCLHHLIMLMVHVIESTLQRLAKGSGAAATDGVVSGKEMRSFAAGT